MKPLSRKFSVLATIVLLFTLQTAAQVCSNPSGIIYGMTNTGIIYPITVSNASVGAAINSAFGSPSSSNALGYNSLNGLFYYFNVNYSSQQFVSYNPLTSAYSVLKNCPLTTTVRTGCVTADNKGYYCLDMNANLFYYDILSDKWKNVTSTWFDNFGANITNTVKNQSSGDMADDGNGSLWLLLSGSSNYGLYKISVPPTSAVASITATQIIAPNTATPDGNTIAGIAFNSNGSIFLSTLSDHLYELINTSTIVLRGTFSTAGVGIDLTSCNFPHSILPVIFLNFIVSPNNNDIDISWEVAQQPDSKVYYVEQSMDNSHFERINMQASNMNDIDKYSFRATNVPDGKHFYRICLVNAAGNITYSSIKEATINNNRKIGLWPNPSKDFIRIQNLENSVLKIQIVDPAGRTVKESHVKPGINTFEVNNLPSGTYTLIVLNKIGTSYLKFIKE